MIPNTYIQSIEKQNDTVDDSGKIKNVLFIERETLCDSEITNKVFIFHAVND